MEIQTAQKEVRTVFFGGFFGQLVSGLLWLLSAALTSWQSQKHGIITLIFGGFFIFPAVQLILRLMKRPYSLTAENPMGQLAMQVAFTLPLSLPLVGAASMYRYSWFYPSFMIILGSHYLPFAFLYGMRMFLLLGGLLISLGLFIGLYLPTTISFGAWATGGILILFAFLGRFLVVREQSASA